VVVTRYLFRPRLDRLAALLRPGGVLIYETFMAGNERFGKPSNPDFLLRPHELLDWARTWGQVLAFEQGEIARPAPAMIQRICAVRSDAPPRCPELDNCRICIASECIPASSRLWLLAIGAASR
jgi:hypothetical protein